MKRLIQKVFVVAFAATFGFTACQTESDPEPTGISKAVANETPLPDGMYWLRQTEQDSVLKESIPDAVMIRYSHHFVDTTETDQPNQLWIDTTDYVPLSLSQAPDSIPQEDRGVKLMLTLTEHASEHLASFTGEHVNDRVALVIDGEAVTIHKIRERITGGKLQITRCTDQACSFLYVALQDNVE